MIGCDCDGRAEQCCSGLVKAWLWGGGTWSATVVKVECKGGGGGGAEDDVTVVMPPPPPPPLLFHCNGGMVAFYA